MKYSVIIPMYQAERTIERCLKSLLAQSRDDTEYIIINDGSKDCSGEICRKYASANAAVRYFEKDNGGVSSARNFGLDKARGDYILFVDSDDAVTENYFQVIESELINCDIDLLVFGMKDFECKRQLSLNPVNIERPLEAAEYISDCMKRNKFNPLYTKVFKRSIISQNSIRFNEEVSIAEDLAFIFSYVLHILKLKVISDCIYIIDESNMESLSRKHRPDLASELYYANLDMYKSLELSDCDTAVKKTYYETLNWLFYRSAYSSFKEISKLGLDKKSEKKNIKDICSMYCSFKIKSWNWKTRLISFPVRYKLVNLISFMIKMK